MDRLQTGYPPGEFVRRRSFFPSIKDDDKIKWVEMKKPSIQELAKERGVLEAIFAK